MEARIGTLNFGDRCDARGCEAIVRRALDRGLCWFDTAPAYGRGEAETLLGGLLAGESRARISTKVGLTPTQGNKPGDRSVDGLSAASITASVERSLHRLKRDRIDLLLLHAPDPTTPLDETVTAVGALLRAGVIGSFGLANFASWQALEVVTTCDRLGVARPRELQLLLNPLVRSAQVELLPFAARYRLHVGVYNPLAGGLLARDPALPLSSKARLRRSGLYRQRYGSEELRRRASLLAAWAQVQGRSLPSASYAWLAAQPAVHHVVLGPADPAHVDEALEPLAQPLSASQAAEMETLLRGWDGTDASHVRSGR